MALNYLFSNATLCSASICIGMHGLTRITCLLGEQSFPPHDLSVEPLETGERLLRPPAKATIPAQPTAEIGWNALVTGMDMGAEYMASKGHHAGPLLPCSVRYIRRGLYSSCPHVPGIRDAGAEIMLVIRCDQQTNVASCLYRWFGQDVPLHASKGLCCP